MVLEAISGLIVVFDLVRFGELLTPRLRDGMCGGSVEVTVENGINGGGPELCT